MVLDPVCWWPKRGQNQNLRGRNQNPRGQNFTRRGSDPGQIRPNSDLGGLISSQRDPYPHLRSRHPGQRESNIYVLI